MKVEVTKQQETKRQYPYLAIHADDTNRKDPMVVLFTSTDEGVVLSHNECASYRHVGEVDNWCESEFVVFNGEVTLRN